MTLIDGAAKKLEAHVWEREANEHYVEPHFAETRTLRHSETLKGHNVVDAEELAKCFDADELRGYSPIRNFTREERRAISWALRTVRVSNASPPAFLTERLIQAAVDYESGRCSQRELSEARAAVELAISSGDRK